MPIYTPGKLTLAKTFTWNETVWNPRMVGGIQMWLDASDASTVSTVSGAVSQWTDKSGNGKNATQSTPGSRPGYSNNRITFNGSTFLTCTPGWGNYWEWFLVLKYDRTDVLQVSIRDDAQPGQSTEDTAVIGYTSTSTSFYRVRNTPNSSYSTSLAVEFGTITRIQGYSSRSSNQAFAFVDGTQKTSWNVSGVMGSTLWFGVNGELGGQGLQGSICEFILLSSEASDANRQRIEGYLAWKWGLTANLPSNHPYKTVGPTP